MRFDEAKALLDAFEHEGVRYVLVGSMAMAAQGLVRATRDIDFFIAADKDNVERMSQEMTVEGTKVRVATPRMLYRMKRSTVRPQDRLDAETLREHFGLSEEGEM